MLRKEMSVDMATLRSEMSADMATMRADLKGDIHELRAEMHKQGQRMTTRLGAVAVAAVGIIVAFDKLF